MGIIAVAGGSGPVGRTIVDALVAHGRHKVYVFSRNVRFEDGFLSVVLTRLPGTCIAGARHVFER